MATRGGTTPYLGPYLVTHARPLGKGLPGLPGLPGALPGLSGTLPGLPGPYLAVEHCILPGLTWPSLCCEWVPAKTIEVFLAAVPALQR